MESKSITCSKKLHEKIDAIIYCQECNIYMCNKCKQSHSDLFESHHLHNLNKNINDIFTGLCKDAQHHVDFEYFCKTHNILCCAKCISKFQKNGSGKHGNCDICLIDDIKNEKKEKLNENIKILEDLSNNLNQSIDELKNIFEKINKDKENLQIKIQKAFSELRSKINKKEDELLSRVNNEFKRLFFDEKFLKISESLPNKVNEILEKGKLINKEWKDDKSTPLINECINIEQSIKDINRIKNKIKKINSKNITINFTKKYEPDEIENDIKDFGYIIHKNDKYSFRECPINLEENKKYEVVGKCRNIVNKRGSNCWVGVLCENKLSKRRLNCWKIIINANLPYNILIGVANNEFDVSSPSFYNNGWFICLCCNQLYSGAPQNIKNKKINLDLLGGDEIILIMDMKKHSLKVRIDSNEEEIYKEIPTDKPLFPAVFLKYKNDSVEIYDYHEDYINILKEKKDEKKEEKKEGEKKEEEEKKE